MSDPNHKRRSERGTPSLAVSAAKRYAGELRRYFNRRLGRAQDIDDLAQEVYFRLLRLDPDRRIEKPLAFVYGVARRVLADHRERSAVDEGHVSMTEDEPSSWPASEALRDRLEDNLDVERQLHNALSEIPPMHAAILILHKRDGLSYKEVAAELGISVHTVHKYLTEARARMRMKLWST